MTSTGTELKKYWAARFFTGIAAEFTSCTPVTPVGRQPPPGEDRPLIAHADRLRFAPVVQPVGTEITAGAGLLHAAERQVGVYQRVAVHPHGTGL